MKFLQILHYERKIIKMMSPKEVPFHGGTLPWDSPLTKSSRTWESTWTTALLCRRANCIEDTARIYTPLRMAWNTSNHWCTHHWEWPATHHITAVHTTENGLQHITSQMYTPPRMACINTSHHITDVQTSGVVLPIDIENPYGLSIIDNIDIYRVLSIRLLVTFPAV